MSRLLARPKTPNATKPKSMLAADLYMYVCVCMFSTEARVVQEPRVIDEHAYPAHLRD